MGLVWRIDDTREHWLSSGVVGLGQSQEGLLLELIARMIDRIG